MNDTLAAALSKILNAERLGRNTVDVKPISKTIRKVLELMNTNRYVGGYTIHEDGRGNFISVDLIGKVNACGAVKPRSALGKDSYEKYEKRYLPAKGFGILIVSTVHGIMTHQQAQKKGVGGRLIAYVY